MRKVRARIMMVVLVLVLALGFAGCGHPLSEDAVPLDCDVVAVVDNARIFGDEEIVVEEGQVLAVKVDGQPTGGFGVQRSVAAFGIIDVTIDNTDGWPPLSKEPGAYYQQFTSDFGNLVVIDVDPGFLPLDFVSSTRWHDRDLPARPSRRIHLTINYKGSPPVDAGDGNNQVSAFNGDDTVVSGSGNDVLNLGGGDDTATSGAGNDRINASGGNEALRD